MTFLPNSGALEDPKSMNMTPSFLFFCGVKGGKKGEGALFRGFVP